ncbi:hypothetical protein HOY82DRAFT_579113 [Tuber indicum]|nr:hypothetical protein HOY82DRAFT_579113 [Tuber indicum]
MADQSDLPNLQSHLRASLRRYPDFPKPGIMFEDILPIFASPVLHETLLQALELHIQSAHPPTLTPPPGSCRVSVCAWRTRRSTAQIGSRCRWAPLSRGRGCWLSTILLPPGGAQRLLGSWWGCWVGCSWRRSWGLRRRRWGRRKRKRRRGGWRTSSYRWCTVNGRDGVIKVMLLGMGLDCSWGHVFDSSHKCSQK